MTHAFFTDDWFDEFLRHAQSCVGNFHECPVITYASDAFPHIVVRRKGVQNYSLNRILIDIEFVICTDYKGQKQEVRLVNAVKKMDQHSIALNDGGSVLLRLVGKEKFSEKKTREVILPFQMTLRLKV